MKTETELVDEINKAMADVERTGSIDTSRFSKVEIAVAESEKSRARARLAAARAGYASFRAKNRQHRRIT